ncbi:MAG: hypothetical protein MUD11_10260 [Rhodobacteraceae bacterium]|jgi:hypothetical protein|nr:hypothetical protein [Paracoccaceae bacterium]
MTDDSHRIHLAANDPAFPAQREAAFAVIVAAICDVLLPLGYAQVGSTWRRETAAGRSAINLQRSRYGFDASMTLRFLLPDGSPIETGAWADSPEIPLSAFCAGGSDVGLIRYLDVRDDPASLDRPMSVLRDQALPWLEAHHAGLCPPITPQPPR